MNEQAGVSTTEARIAGFMKGIKKYKNIKVLKTQFTGDSPAQAASDDHVAVLGATRTSRACSRPTCWSPRAPTPA